MDQPNKVISEFLQTKNVNIFQLKNSGRSFDFCGDYMLLHRAQSLNLSLGALVLPDVKF